MSGRGDGRPTGSGDDRAPLDGAFLLQLLRRPPKPQHQPTASPSPPPPFHYEVRQPHQNPTNAGFSPHNFVRPHRPPPPPEPYSDPHRFPLPSQPAFHHVPTNPTGFHHPRSNYQNSHIPASHPIFTHSPPPRNDHREDRWNPRGEGFSHDRQNFYSSRTSGSLRSGERAPPNPNIGFQRAMGEPTPPNPNIGFQKAMEGSFARTSSESVIGMNSGFRPIRPSRGPFERNHPHSETSSGPGRHEAFPRFGMVGNGQRNPTGPVSKPKGPGEWVASKGKQDGGSQNVEKGEYIHSKETDQFNGEVKEPTLVLNHRLNRSRDASVSNLHEAVHCKEFLNESESLSEAVEGTVSIVRKHMKHVQVDDFAFGEGSCEMDALSEQLMDSLNSLNHQDDNVDKKVKDSNTRRAKDLRSDSLRGLQVSSQRIRIRRRGTQCRHDIDSLAPSFLSIYESLIPADEEIARQKQLLLSLRKLVSQEWPNAQLHLYGSCANSFGVSKSDIDICLAIDDTDLTKSDILLRLADILLSNNIQNVQALTRARVPIVKMMDPVTGISCDICINNLLAVVNSKLLRDYARIDERLRQLAFIVKHWAKSRGVNETYRGTLSSYAYVLMCIHFLQRRNPAILPCLQEMEATYVVTVDGTECSYFDQVEELHDFGVRNKENVAQLLWAFFHYWAFFHDFMDDVISVRTGHIIRKVEKDWTRRVGFDRHLICIEDPFETSHDLGRVVDKFTIKILREEFERAAYILQYDPNPSVTLFEPYVPRLMTQD